MYTRELSIKINQASSKLWSFEQGNKKNAFKATLVIPGASTLREFQNC